MKDLLITVEEAYRNYQQRIMDEYGLTRDDLTACERLINES